MPDLITAQTELLIEADLEPLLWRPDFFTRKYQQVIELCQELRVHLTLWDSIVRWQQRHHESNTVGLTTSEETEEKWMYNSIKFKNTVS